MRRSAKDVKRKRCVICQKQKQAEQFSRAATGYLCSYCKPCARDRARTWARTHRKEANARGAALRAERRAWLDSLKNQPCLDCGIHYPPYVMDFDHRDVRKKVASVSALALKATPKAAILAEIAKCDLVCANCHRERTHQQRLRGEIAVNKRKPRCRTTSP